jgi:hypothetical protein
MEEALPGGQVQSAPEPGSQKATEHGDQQEAGDGEDGTGRTFGAFNPRLDQEEESSRGEISDQDAGPEPWEAARLGPRREWRRGGGFHHVADDPQAAIC